ncbi:MAG: HAD family hydrolase [Bacteroidota bacterium]
MNKAVFLDRDGVINSNANHYYVYKADDFKLNQGVIETLNLLIKKGYLLIIISNQGGVSKNKYSKADIEKLNEHINSLFTRSNIKISESYYCPHHSDIENCICRKPDSLMIEKAISRFNISIPDSFMIGDSERDIEAAEKLGIKGIKVKANSNLFEEITNSDYSFLVDRN